MSCLLGSLAPVEAGSLGGGSLGFDCSFTDAVLGLDDGGGTAAVVSVLAVIGCVRGGGGARALGDGGFPSVFAWVLLDEICFVEVSHCLGRSGERKLN